MKQSKCHNWDSHFMNTIFKFNRHNTAWKNRCESNHAAIKEEFGRINPMCDRMSKHLYPTMPKANPRKGPRFED